MRGSKNKKLGRNQKIFVFIFSSRINTKDNVKTDSESLSIVTDYGFSNIYFK